MSSDDVSEDVNVRVLKRFLEIKNKILSIIPKDQQDKYHLLFGEHIMASADTMEEITKKQNELSGLHLFLYYPEFRQLN